MRGALALFSVAALVFAGAGHAAAQSAAGTSGADVLATIAGHWSCVASNGARSERSYAIFHPSPPIGPHGLVADAYGREDSTINGEPAASYESILEHVSGTFTIDSVDGSGSGAASAAGLTFAGTGPDGHAVVISYVEPASGTLQRTVSSGTATLSSERCTRQPTPPAPARCDTPDTAAKTLHAVEPPMPAGWERAPLKGSVYVRVVLDDRSNVLWTEVNKSDWSGYDDAAVASTRDSTYQTATRNCKPVPGIYIFTVTFMHEKP